MFTRLTRSRATMDPILVHGGLVLMIFNKAVVYAD